MDLWVFLGEVTIRIYVSKGNCGVGASRPTVSRLNDLSRKLHILPRCISEEWNTVVAAGEVRVPQLQSVTYPPLHRGILSCSH